MGERSIALDYDAAYAVALAVLREWRAMNEEALEDKKLHKEDRANARKIIKACNELIRYCSV